MKPNVVVSIPAHEAKELSGLAQKAREQLGQDVLVELTLEKEPFMSVDQPRALLVGRKAIEGWLGV